MRQRPVDISLVVFQHGVDAFERDRQVVHHPRQTLLHVGQFGSGRRQHVARLGRHERVALRQQLRAVAHLDSDRLAAHETVAVNARLGVARNPEGAPHGELQHDVAAHRRIEADRGDRPDLHALNGDGRGGLDPADLRISHIIGNIAAENIDAAQKADAAPQAAQHDDGEHAYLYLSSHNSECLSGDRITFVTHDVSVAEALLHLRQRTLGFGLRRVTTHTILITVAARGT